MREGEGEGGVREGGGKSQAGQEGRQEVEATLVWLFVTNSYLSLACAIRMCTVFLVIHVKYHVLFLSQKMF